MNDPIVAEVRRHRDNHAKQFNYNIDAICADYRSKHNQYVEQLKQAKTVPTRQIQRTASAPPLI